MAPKTRKPMESEKTNPIQSCFVGRSAFLPLIIFTNTVRLFSSFRVVAKISNASGGAMPPKIKKPRGLRLSALAMAALTSAQIRNKVGVNSKVSIILFTPIRSVVIIMPVKRAPGVTISMVLRSSTLLTKKYTLVWTFLFHGLFTSPADCYSYPIKSCLP